MGPTVIMRRSNQAAIRRRGFTLPELVVSVSVCGLLVAVLMPAVQHARESARRSVCASHLRETGIALHLHAETHRHFPRGGDMVFDGIRGNWPRAHAPHVYLLPYLGYQKLFDTFDRRIAAERGLDAAASNANQPLSRELIPLFLCASDPYVRLGRNSYRANIGVTAFPRYSNVQQSPPPPGGPFYPVERALRPADFVSGMSQTVAFSEKLVGDWSSLRYRAQSEYFFVWQVVDADLLFNSPTGNADFVSACAQLRHSLPAHESTEGGFWFYAGLTDTWYCHLLTPNHAVPDCGAVSGMAGGGVMTARSAHPGGVNALRMDGSVSFAQDGIDAAVWRSMGIR